MKKRLLVLAAALAVVSAAPASASLVYGTGAYGSPYSVAVITGQAPAGNAVTNFGSEGLGLAAFTDAAGEDRLLVMDQAASDGADSAFVYAYKTNDWAAVPLKNIAWDKVLYFRGAEALGRYLYVIGNGISGSSNGWISKIDTADDAYTAVKDVECTTVRDSCFCNPEKLFEHDGKLYVIANEVQGCSGYYNKLMRFDADLALEGELGLKCMNFNGNPAIGIKGDKLYIAAMGPTYSSNANAAVEKIDLAAFTSKVLISGDVVSADDPGWSAGNYNFRGVLVMPNNDVYIGAYGSAYDASASAYTNNYRLYRTDLAGLEAGDLTSADRIYEDSGEFSSANLTYDPYEDIVYFDAAGKYVLFKDGVNIKELSYASLGGSPSHAVAVAEVAPAAAASGGASGGGCNAGFAGLLVFAALPAALLSGKKK